MSLEAISLCVKEEFVSFENRFRDCMPCGEGTIGLLTEHVLSQKGKRLRPLVSFLVAKACGQVTESTYRAAIILELLHTASLVHDDVLDESDLRRDKPTINRLWGNKTAILFGDYIYGKCLHLIETKKDFELLEIYSKVARELPQGELLQKDISESQDYGKESYFRVIDRKTASLFGASAYIGAKTATEEKDYSFDAEQFGRLLGRAFQIRDDMLDFDMSSIGGKGFGNDIKEKKITLPLIFLLESLNESDREYLLGFIAREDKTEREIKALIEAVCESDCLDKSEEEVRRYSLLAKEHLQLLPDNEYRKKLEELTDYLVLRKL
ncbi:MAG: polyprenyl synthetase family protein [Bacteroidales bacterium]|nr:polyprenyl synthetase family protein [Bacteroidales bacterium]